MRRLSQDEGFSQVARKAAQDGFTLIELLVTMLLTVVVIGSGTIGIAEAFRTTSESSSRTAATNQAEVRLEVLTRDLRQSTPCPASLVTGASKTLDGTTAAGLVIGSTAAVITLQMCDPAPGLPVSAAGSQVPQSALVTWTCTVATESCSRQVQDIAGAVLTGNVILTNTLTGVTALTLTGSTVPSGSSSAVLTTLATLGTATATTDYLLSPGGTNRSISWVGIAASIASLKSLDSTSNLTPATASAPVRVQTGVALRNSQA